MTTRRQRIFKERQRRIVEMYQEVDKFGRPRYTLAEIKREFNLKSNQGIYYCISQVLKEDERRRQHGLASKTRKDLTNN